MSDPMDARRALALAVMACQHVGDTEGSDVLDWQQAAGVLRAMLADLQPAQGPCVLYTGPAGYRGGKERRGTNGRAHS